MNGLKELLQAEGIVLNAFPFKEYDKIVTLFTRERGIIKLYVKGTSTLSSLRNVLTAPLTIGEYFFYEGRGEMFRFSEGALLDPLFSLRESFETLQAAQFLIGSIFKSHWPEKPSPQLYDLLLLFLNKIPEAASVNTLVASFLLKVLKHEGILEIPTGESGKVFTFLAETRVLKDLLSFHVPDSILQEIEVLFNQSI